MAEPPYEDLFSEIGMLEKKCRDALQYDAVLEELKAKGKAFNELCALLDFIGDSESALASVSSSKKRNKLEHYLLAYGLLQTMYTRQISLKKVLETLDIPFRKV